MIEKAGGDEWGLVLEEIKEIPLVARSRFPAIVPTDREPGIGYVRRDKRFGLKIKVLPWATILVSRGNNVVSYNAISRTFLLRRQRPTSCFCKCSHGQFLVNLEK